MSIHSASKKGLRNQNEDKHVIFLNINNENPEKQPINLYAVFDGHGGKYISKFVSEYLPEKFLTQELEYPLNGKTINRIYKNINQELINNHKKSATHCGSTGLVVLEYKYNNSKYVDIINTGDSRCVICTDNIANVKTKDHKPNFPEERERIKSLGGKVYYDGYDWRVKDLSVSRAFGDLDAAPFVTNKPDIYRHKIRKNDKFMILACDGLWDVIDNQEAINIVLNEYYDIKTGKKLNVKKNVAKQLAETAIQKGSTDNVTVLVVFFD
jgi:serine/threonine protein phosphatase PrpC